MKAGAVSLAIVSLLACFSNVGAQTFPPAPKKQVDIGAREAPLTDAERVDLDKAVTKHDYAAEKAVMDRALTEHPASFELLVMKGRLAYLERQAPDAADALERADKIKPLTEQDRLTLALAYQFSRKTKEARNELQKLTGSAPNNAEYVYLLGRLDAQNQQPEAAEKDFAKAIKLNPKLVRAYEELGEVQEQLGRAEDARKTYEAGAAANRKLAAPWEWSPLDLGVAMLKTNEYDASEKLIREALRYNPRFAWGHYYLAQIQQKRGRNTDAVTEYKEAVVDDPRLRQAWLALGREFARQGDKVESDKCIAIFKKLEEQQNALKGRKN